MALDPLWLVASSVVGVVAVAFLMLWRREVARAERLQHQLNQAQQRLSEHQDDMRALQARLDRISRDHDQQLDRRRRDTLNDLLPIDDHLRRALSHARDASGADLDSLRQGIELCARDLDRLWQSCGLTRLQPPPQTPFDPALHEAIASHPHPAATRAVVAQVFEAGFQMGDQLLRPARVLVHTPPPSEPPPDLDEPIDDDAPDQSPKS